MHEARAFNIATSKETSVLELAETVGRVMGVPPVLEFAPTRPGELLRSALDVRKAGALLGWKPGVQLRERPAPADRLVQEGERMMLQVGGALPTTPLELLLISSVETKVVLAILLVFSLIAWFIIVLKWWQFRRLHRQGGKFFAELERTTRLQEGYHAAMKQPPSPYNRLFREAINFYSELRPGALKEEVARTPLTVDPARVPQAGPR